MTKSVEEVSGGGSEVRLSSSQYFSVLEGNYSIVSTSETLLADNISKNKALFFSETVVNKHFIKFRQIGSKIPVIKSFFAKNPSFMSTVVQKKKHTIVIVSF